MVKFDRVPNTTMRTVPSPMAIAVFMRVARRRDIFVCSQKKCNAYFTIEIVEVREARKRRKKKRIAHIAPPGI